MFLLARFWWAIPLVAVVLWYFLMQYARKILNRVEYHRRGGTRSGHRCRIEGTNVTFKPNPRSKFKVTVPIEADPETEIKGMNTRRIYHVAEGGGRTFSFVRNIDKIVEEVYDYFKEFMTKKDKNPSEADIVVMKTNVGRLLEAIHPKSIGVPKEASEAPQMMSASASMTLFERWVTHLAEHLPKGKGEWVLMFLYIVVGFGMGMPWGLLAGKLGWV